MKIGLFVGDDKIVRGPYKVAQNLLAGLKNIGVEVSINQVEELTGCLRSGVPGYYDLPKKTVMGPNLVVLPEDDPQIWSLYKNFVVPSQWVKDLYKIRDLCQGTNIQVWPVGIDTEKFIEHSGRDIDCLIYFKGRERLELGSMLKDFEISSLSLTYGFYTEQELIEYTKRCKFCILLTETESQGIAYMEILSSGLPCFVFNTNAWRDVAASSVPYFSDLCGKICGSNPYMDFQEFLNNLDKYNPRQYILDNHTLEKSAARYVEILEGWHNNG